MSSIVMNCTKSARWIRSIGIGIGIGHWHWALALGIGIGVPKPDHASRYSGSRAASRRCTLHAK